MNTFMTIMLQDAAQQGTGWGFWVPMILIFGVMWLFMIRPQQKKQKELEEQRKQMKNGDKVVTAGGIHGRIKDVNDDTVLMEIAKGVDIRVDKTSVFAVPAPTPKKEEKNDGAQKGEVKIA